MALYIAGQKAPDQSFRIIVIYGPFGARKSSLASTADNNIIFDFDGGTQRMPNEGLDKNRFIIERGWHECANFIREGKADQFNVIITDTPRAAIDKFLANSVMEDQPGLKDVNGSLTIGGYGVMYNRYEDDYLKPLRNKILIFVCAEDTEGDDTNQKKVPLISGKTRQFILGQADLIGHISKVDDKIFLDFSTSGKFDSKDSQKAKLGRMEIPHLSDPLWPRFMQTQIIDKMGWLPKEAPAEAPPRAQGPNALKEDTQVVQSVIDKIKSTQTPVQLNKMVAALKKSETRQDDPPSKATMILLKNEVATQAALKGWVKGKGAKGVYMDPAEATPVDTPGEPPAEEEGQPITE